MTHLFIASMRFNQFGSPLHAIPFFKKQFFTINDHVSFVQNDLGVVKQRFAFSCMRRTVNAQLITTNGMLIQYILNELVHCKPFIKNYLYVYFQCFVLPLFSRLLQVPTKFDFFLTFYQAAQLFNYAPISDVVHYNELKPLHFLLRKKGKDSHRSDKRKS